MSIPFDYYQSEVREGFYIPSEMKRCWAATLSVLEVVEGICRRHNLEYFADYGTLLGAVRHGGFIPWDDDFDISMKREDYMRFIKYAQEELPKDYLALSFYTNYQYDNYLCRVVSRDFVCIEEEFLRDNHCFPYITGIDIFPLDNFEEDEGINQVQKMLFDEVKYLAACVDKEETDINNLDTEYQERIISLCKGCNCTLEQGKPIVQQIYILADRLSAIYDSDSDKVSNIYFFAKNGSHVYPKEWFSQTVRVPFEYTTIPVPIGYDRILQSDYGPDYMTPIMSWDYHDYPVYKGQKDVLTEAKGSSFFKEYIFDEKDIAPRKEIITNREKKEAVFLPFRGKYWTYMEKEWARLSEDPKWDVYVVPIPYYDKKEYGLKGDIHYEVEGYPDYVPLTGFDKYDFDKRKPDRIYIQNPYDDYDNAITVHPRFYTENLIEITSELIYIPYFEVMDFRKEDERMNYAAGFYVKVPGVTRADKVILSSDNLKERYIDILCDFAGEDTRAVWNKRIIVDKDILPDKVIGIYEEDVPDDWWKYLFNSEGEGRKVVLYHTSVSTLVTYGEKYLDKINRNLEVFKQNKDALTVLWNTGSNTRIVLEAYYPDLWEKYSHLVSEYISGEMGIYEETDDYTKATAIADAYYGDRDLVMNACKNLGKPVMIQNVEM